MLQPTNRGNMSWAYLVDLIIIIIIILDNQKVDFFKIFMKTPPAPSTVHDKSGDDCIYLQLTKSKLNQNYQNYEYATICTNDNSM